ncbi:MAG: S-layer homology domain-containing protein [Dysosmobacter welbionis]|uniref:S-layer homology domain-containing protein n=1 Tax=Dysosmobacter welbionis TaxID=2093857 RepID=UPI003995DE2C
MKKFLSLVLALVMTMSLVTVSAGAKDFSDDDSITYQEAVDVISEIGVVDGYTGGDFKPTDVLTRGAAAKIICNLILGPTTASALSASSAPFKDVPVSNTFAGYITYCAQEKIINGYSDGTFRPTATLSGNAFMKMLLGALGYDGDVEGYTGPNWSVAVIKQAAGIGLDDGNDEFVGSKAVTREEAALYAFNMLQATMVEYDAKTSVDINGATVTIAGDKAKEIENTSRTDGYIDDDNKMQFAERYFTDLRLTTDTTDDFGRPANTWRFKGVEVGTFAKTADATYTADVKLGQIYSDLGMSDKDEAAPVFVDGVEASESAKVSKGNDLKVSELKFTNSPAANCNVGNGTLVEAYLDEDTNDVTIVAINTYVAEVNKVVAETNSKDAYITLSELAAENGATSGLRANDEFETTGFENDQIVLFTYANNEIQSVKAAESAEGTLTRKVSGKSINLGETKYDFSKMYSVDGGESSLGIDSEYVVYLDANGYAIYVEETEYNIADYAYLRALQGSSVAFASDKAALITYDGKMKTVDTKEDYTNDFAGYGSELQIGNANSEIVLVKETSNGEYRLKDLDTKNPSIAKAEDSFELRNGVARINLTATGVAGNGTQGTDYIYADSKTVFVVGTYDSGVGEDWKDATYRAYTGINNAPTIVDDNDSSAATNAIGMSYYCRNNGVATIVYLSVDEADYKVTGGNNDVIFFAFESGSKKIEDSDNEYYTYNAVVDGKIVEGVKVDASVKINNRTSNGSFSSNVVFTGADYDDGVITGLDSLSNSGTVTGINKVNNENVVLGYGSGSESTYVVADDAKIFFIDDDGTITEGAVSNIRRSDEDVVTYVLEDGQISYLFVQQYFEDNDQSSSGGRQELTSITGATYANPNLTLTLNGTNAGQNYKVTLKMIVAGVTTELGTYTVTGATGATSTTAVLSVGTLASIAASGGIYMVSCGGQNATFTA